MTQEHIVKIYDKDLKQLDQLIAEMGGQVEQLLSRSVQSLVEYDLELAEKVIADDQKIDQLERDIDAQATRLLTLRQLGEMDLRAIIAALHIANDLERMGDHAKNNSKRVNTLTKVPLLSTMGMIIERLSKLVEEMIQSVLDAYIARDEQLALTVIRQDAEVDILYTSLFREILTYMMEDPASITACTHFLFIAKNIERIGDHATNIAEQVYYIVKGERLDEGHINYDRSSSVISELSKDR